MDSKVALITGASSGIGAATAVHFAKSGYKKLVLVARREQRLLEVKQECLAKGAKVVLVLTKDLSKPEENNEESIIKATIDHFGRLDIVIANAGMSSYVSARYSVKYKILIILND